MRAGSWMAACLALGITTQAAAGEGMSVPREWADYLAAVRKADAIVDEEARCAAHPDLPGNAWVPGSAMARCTLLRAPALSLDQIDARLDSKDGLAELERTFEALLEAHYTQQEQREQIFRTLTAFDHSDRARAVSDRWLKLAPDSAFANVASAHHHAQVGWFARGASFMSKISDRDIAKMQEAFLAAVPLYAKALKLNSRLSPACVGLMDIGRQSSREIEQYATAACMKVDPDSYHVAWAAIRSAQPRWGGSEEALRHAVAYAAARVDRNPILGALLGEAAGDPLTMADDYGDVVSELAEVAKMAPSGTLIAAAGRGYRARKDDWRAFVHISQGLRFWPRNDDWRAERANVLMRLGDYEWAQGDMRLALEIDDSDGWRHYRMGQIQEELAGGEEAARPYFKRAMEDPESRRAAIAMYCQSFLLQKRIEEGAECTRALVEEFPDHGEGWRLREWALQMQGDASALEARANFVRHADADDPVHRKRLAELQSETPKMR